MPEFMVTMGINAFVLYAIQQPLDVERLISHILYVSLLQMDWLSQKESGWNLRVSLDKLHSSNRSGLRLPLLGS